MYDQQDYYDLALKKGDLYYTHGQFAGVIYALMQEITIKDSYFTNNSNYKGGAIYINKKKNLYKQFIHFEKVIFNLSRSGDGGGAISFDKDIQYIYGNIDSCLFQEGFSGWRKININLKIQFKSSRSRFNDGI